MQHTMLAIRENIFDFGYKKVESQVYKYYDIVVSKLH